MTQVVWRTLKHNDGGEITLARMESLGRIFHRVGNKVWRLDKVLAVESSFRKTAIENYWMDQSLFNLQEIKFIACFVSLFWFYLATFYGFWEINFWIDPKFGGNQYFYPKSWALPKWLQYNKKVFWLFSKKVIFQAFIDLTQKVYSNNLLVWYD